MHSFDKKRKTNKSEECRRSESPKVLKTKPIRLFKTRFIAFYVTVYIFSSLTSFYIVFFSSLFQFKIALEMLRIR